MNPSRFCQTIACVSLLVLGTGCPQRFTRSYATPSPDHLLDTLRARQSAVQGVELETRTESALGGERVRATVLMLVARDGRLRFEAEVSLKGTVAALATDGVRYDFVDMDRQRMEHGPACAYNVATLVRIPLEPKEIAGVLLGDAPVGEGATALDVGWDESLGTDVLHLREVVHGESRELWVFMKRIDSARGYAIVRVEGATGRNSKHFSVGYEDFKQTGGLLLPDRIRFAEPGRSFDDGVDIEVKSRTLNPKFTDRAFTLETPEGFSVDEVGCGEGR
ncbi:MAG: hypothetical protein SGI86_18990 [Deltaproteobacteria bacterium]|nr:hypothetical protein [Deltaproteobacteria bacterium]